MKIIIPLLILTFSSFAVQTKAENSFLNFANQNAYVGCWFGMNGGRLKITANKIFDLGSKENSLYKEKPTVKKDIKGIQTGEEYLLEASADFQKSFLAKWVRFSFNSDGTVGITAYDSRNDYLENKFVGMGLFQKTNCRGIK